VTSLETTVPVAADPAITTVAMTNPAMIIPEATEMAATRKAAMTATDLAAASPEATERPGIRLVTTSPAERPGFVIPGIVLQAEHMGQIAACTIRLCLSLAMPAGSA
jgi:hypothetical protein